MWVNSGVCVDFAYHWLSKSTSTREFGGSDPWLPPLGREGAVDDRDRVDTGGQRAERAAAVA